MFNFFKSKKCPVTDVEKDWIESNLIWLAKEFGYDYLLNQEILTPKTDLLIKAVQNASRTNIDSITEYSCKQMNVEHDRVTFQLMDKPKEIELVPGMGSLKRSGVSGLYDNAYGDRVRICKSELDNTVSLVSTLSHELGHVRLLGEMRISAEEEEDHELLTDLTTVFFGFGVLRANSATHFKQYHDRWESSQKGYMSVQMYAYALAIIALCRGEIKPSWRDELCYNGKAWFDQSLRFIAAHKNCPFYPFFNGFDKDFVPLTWSSTQERLQLAVALEDYEYAAALQKHLENGNPTN